MSFYRNLIWQIDQEYRIFIEWQAWYFKLENFEKFYNRNGIWFFNEALVLQGQFTPILLCYILLILYYQLGMNSSKFTDSERLTGSFKTTMIETTNGKDDDENQYEKIPVFDNKSPASNATGGGVDLFTPALSADISS